MEQITNLQNIDKNWEKIVLVNLKKYSLIKKSQYKFLKSNYDILLELKKRNPVLYNQIINLDFNKILNATIEARKIIIKFYASKETNLNSRILIKENSWEAKLQKTDGICPTCKNNVGILNLTKDHIISRILGGRDVIKNLQPLCLSCNSKKNWKIEDVEVTKKIIKEVGLKKGYDPNIFIFLMEVEEIVHKALTEKEYEKYKKLLEVWSKELAKKYIRGL